MSDELRIQSAALRDDGQSLQVTIAVHNPANRTRFAYGSVRALRYDRATRTLEIQLSDHGLTEPRDLRGVPSSATAILPQVLQVEPNSSAEISLRLERTITRVDPARSHEVIRLETLPIHEATDVKVDVAWGETPFYQDPRRPFELRKQLVDWSKGRAQHHVKLKPRESTK